MDNRAIEIFTKEVDAQHHFAVNAILVLNNSLKQLDNENLQNEERLFHHHEVFRTLHSFLTHMSNISKLFWPIKTDSKQRGESLRAHLKIEDDSLLKKRTLRDHLEHFDERLDHWSQSSKRKNIAMDNIGPWGSIQGIDSTDCMRWYDKNAKQYIFQGEKYDIQELCDELGKLGSKLDALKAGFPLSRE